MKRIISLLVIVVVLVLAFFRFKSDLLVVFDQLNIEYSLCDFGDECVVISIEGVDYNYIIDALDLEIVNKKEIADRLVVEGYSSKIHDYITINNRKINIQLSIVEDMLFVGNPLIYNSFWNLCIKEKYMV